MGSIWCFNLVIEILIVDRARISAYDGTNDSFNLVIEILIVDRTLLALLSLEVDIEFQSRNRDSYS